MEEKAKILSEENAVRRSAIDCNGNVKHHVYVDEDGEAYFSATTVLGNWSNEEKEAKLQSWREKNNGENGTEHHEDLLRYSQLRGTLCHAKAQEKYSDEQIWGEEEDMAKQELKSFGEFKGQDAYEKYEEDVDWFVDEIHNLLDSEIDEVLFIEEYCYHSNPDYAGQVDLVYRNQSGEVVVCDLKTSKHVSYSYYLQSNAYAKVIEEELDETVSKLQIARANPDEKTSELHTIDRDAMSIRATEVFEDEYGYRVAIESPYIAKQDIKGLDWNLFHQDWNSDKNKWTLTVKNKNNTVTIDLAFSRLSKRGWTVSVPESIKQELRNHVESEDLILDKIRNPYSNYGEQLTQQFYELAKQENKNKPLKFVEDIIQEHRSEFSDEVVDEALSYIEEHKGNLGDIDPRESCSAILSLCGAEKNTIQEVFSPQEMERIKSLYEAP